MARKQNRFSHHNRPRQGRPTEASRLIAGRNPLREILRTSPQRIEEVMTVSRASGEAAALIAEAERQNIPVRYVSENDLAQMAGGVNHQSFIARLAEPEPMSLDELTGLLDQSERALVVVADGIQDPHNLGAIFRAAECFGATAMLWSKNRTVSITPTVTKAAVGATELVPVCEVSNLASALRTLKEHDCWIVGAAGSPDARDIYEFEYPAKTALVLGSEGEGMRDLTRKLCDFLVRIPMYGQIDSLNVSQAAAVLMALARQP